MTHPSDEGGWPGLRIEGRGADLEVAEEAAWGALGESLAGAWRDLWLEGDDGPLEERDGVLMLSLAPGTDVESAARRLSGALETVFEGRPAPCVAPAATPNADWATLWRDFFRPVRVSDRLGVVPAWRDPAEALAEAGIEAADAVAIVIEPGQAFGSGTHATTRLALALLEERLTPGARVLDFGAGSGILSFAAAKLGAGAIVDVEIDPDALENFEQNAERNGLAGRIDYRVGSDDLLRADETFDLIVCNVLLHRVRDGLGRVLERLAPEGIFVLSGFLQDEAREARGVIGELGFAVVESRMQEEWEAFVCRRDD